MQYAWIRNAGLASMVALIAVAGLSLFAGPKDRSTSAELSGFQEVPPISTGGAGEFRAELNAAETELTYRLEYSGTVGTPSMAHIHFGTPGVNGGVIAFLCGGAGKPLCPAAGTVTGTITAADVIGPADQGITNGQFSEVLRAMAEGSVYVNIHTAAYPNGEIRGQLKKLKAAEDDDDDEQKARRRVTTRMTSEPRLTGRKQR